MGVEGGHLLVISWQICAEEISYEKSKNFSKKFVAVAEEEIMGGTRPEPAEVRGRLLGERKEAAT
jgi:hypothetical protein